MIAFFRKLGWLAQRRSKEEQLAAELAVPPGGGNRRAPGRRHVRAGSARGGAAGPGKSGPGAGRHARHVELDAAGTTRPGPAVWGANPAAQSCLHGIGVPVAGAGDRRQHRDLQPHGRIADAIAAGGGPGIARDTEVAHRERRTTRTTPWCITPAATSTTIRSLGKTSPIFPYPAFEALRKIERRALRCVRVPPGAEN